MTPGTYREAFVEHLYAVLDGSLAEMRGRLFREWLERLPFGCEKCGREFWTNAERVGEENLIVCDKCARKVAE